MKKVSLILLIWCFCLWAINSCAQVIPTVTAICDLYGNNMYDTNTHIESFVRKDKYVIRCAYSQGKLKSIIDTSFLRGVDSVHLCLVRTTSDKKIKFTKCNIVKRYTTIGLRGTSIERCLRCYDDMILPKIILFSSRD